jgi:23S rRNA pseudouridine1911/1915/1917 synthase
LEKKSIFVPHLDKSERLDIYLSGVLNFTRAKIKNLVDEGLISIHGKTAKKAGFLLRGGEHIDVFIPEDKPSELKGEAIPLDIFYEDEWLLVINKPPGLVVHPAAGHWEGTLVNALLHHFKALSKIDAGRPGIVHRLDKDTSGLLVVAKTDDVHLELSQQFKSREIEKYYAVLVHGKLSHKEGKIEKPIGRHPRDRKKMSVFAGGRYALTLYRVLEEFSQCSFLECKLETGRTHQIRVHLASMGNPVVGDSVYGKSDGVERQMLHAWKMKFKHPLTGKLLSFEAPLPKDFLDILEACRQNCFHCNSFFIKKEREDSP